MNPHVKELRDRVTNRVWVAIGVSNPSSIVGKSIDKMARNTAQSIINAVVDEILVNVVGADEPDPKYNGHPNTRRNQLRAQIRQQLNRYKELK